MSIPEGLEKYSFHKAVGYNVASCHFFFSDARPDQQKSVLFLSCTSTKEAYFVTFSRQFLASTWQLSYLSRVRPLPVQNCVSMTDDVETLWYNPFAIYLHCIQYYSYLANLALALGCLGFLPGLVLRARQG